MEPDNRGRASRASSTSSLGREVRCGCQYYHSDSLLPERSALTSRPPSRSTMQQPTTLRCSDHEYEPIGLQRQSRPLSTIAPVARITETDVVPVADSDESVETRIVLPLVLGDDIILPLDGKIEDAAMAGRELGEVSGADTEDDLDLTQQLQEELRPASATPAADSRTSREINTSQVDSTTLEESSLQSSAPGLPQRLRSQAVKLRSRVQRGIQRGIQRSSSVLEARRKPSDKSRTASGSGKSEKSRTASGGAQSEKAPKKPSRMERIRTSISEKSKFQLPSKPKFKLPDKAKIHLPDRPKFNIKRPSLQLPSALKYPRKTPTSSEQEKPRSTTTETGSRRGIFDFSTYPRIFDKKSKSRGEYATSSPKESRAVESSTFPRSQKRPSLEGKWKQRFEETAYIGEEHVPVAERGRPWRHPSLEEPRLSIRTEEELMAIRKFAWEKARRRRERDENEGKEDYEEEEEEEEEGNELERYLDEERESTEVSTRLPWSTSHEALKPGEDSYDRLRGAYNEELSERVMEDEKLRAARDEERTRPISRSKTLSEQEIPADEEEEEEEEEVLDEFAQYERAFQPVDPRRFDERPLRTSERGMKLKREEGEEEEEEEGEEEEVESSLRSDKEQQQSSGSSCDRRRRGVIDDIDVDEYYLRERGLAHEDMNLEMYIARARMDEALGSEISGAFEDDDGLNATPPQPPPRRPTRLKNARKRKEGSTESYDAVIPVRPKRERTSMRRSVESVGDLEQRDVETSRHRIVYHTESVESRDPSLPPEPLDDIVVVKPQRRKSSSSSRSVSRPPGDSFLPIAVLPPVRPGTPCPPSFSSNVGQPPPAAPSRKKRLQRTDKNSVESDEKPLTDTTSIDYAMDTQDDVSLFKPETTPEKFHEEIIPYIEDDEVVLRSEPIPPKRRSRSRTVSLIREDVRRTSDVYEVPMEPIFYDENREIRDIDADSMSSQPPPGYATVEKSDKEHRPFPPRRRRRKFNTTPRPKPPKRPQRTYSTLGPVDKSKSVTNILLSEDSPMIIQSSKSIDTMPYERIDFVEDHATSPLRSGDVMSKVQARPLPAPPRPPRSRKSINIDEESVPSAEVMEVATATQTDPLPDDMVIEEEITQAKLVMSPSRSGSQILISAERLSTPSHRSTPSRLSTPPPVPPLPTTQQLLRKYEDDELDYEKPSSRIAQDSSTTEKPHEVTRETREPIEETQPRVLRTTILPEEPVRIASLEVHDLKVDRLSVSQLEAFKLTASEVDTMVISASEVRNVGGTSHLEDVFASSVLKELIAIRSHLASSPTFSVTERSDRTATDEQPKSRIETPSPSAAIESTESESVVEIEGDRKEAGATTSPPSPPPPPLTVSEQPSNERDSKTSRVALLLPETTLGQFPVTESGSSLDDMDEITTTTTAETDVRNVVKTESSKTDDEVLPKSRESRSRSRSPSPSPTLRQTASPVRSLPPAISVTLDSPEDVTIRRLESSCPQPQRATISFSSKNLKRSNSPARSPELPRSPSESPEYPRSPAGSPTGSPERPSSPVAKLERPISPVEVLERPSSPNKSSISFQPIAAEDARYVTFPISQVPPHFIALASAPTATITPTAGTLEVSADPSITEITQQLLRALRLTGLRAMRYFIGYLTSRISDEDTREKIREMELALCALLLLVAGLLIICFGSPRTVNYYHHWDYFNPPGR